MYVSLVKCANKLIISYFLKIDVDLKFKKTFNTHHWWVASIAQSVEQGIENPRVGGSIPPRGTISSLVQSVERWTVNPYVAGSSPAGGAKF